MYTLKDRAYYVEHKFAWQYHSTCTCYNVFVSAVDTANSFTAILYFVFNSAATDEFQRKKKSRYKFSIKLQIVNLYQIAILLHFMGGIYTANLIFIY